MAGVDSAGVSEVLQSVLARFTEAEKARLVKVGFSFAVCAGADDVFLERVPHGRSVTVSWSPRTGLCIPSADIAT
jgi:hypothetical protein